MTAPTVVVNVHTVTPTGVVSVHRLGLFDTTARCSCGWSGHRRLLKAAAEQDAWGHALRGRCDVSTPLVLAQ